MPGLFYPLIRPEDYQVFKAILGDDIPDSFDEWIDRIAKERAQQRLEWEHSDAVDVEVNPKEFAKYRDATDSTPTYETLKSFAQEKGSRERKR
jgi:hypothetical protein